MSGKRLLDAAQLLNAARNVAKQHLRIQSQHLDVWSKTSSVAKATKGQTDRITLTVQAGGALLRRLNEQVPQQAQDIYQTQYSQHNENIPRQETIYNQTTRSGDANEREGIKQDHHYRPDENNSASDPVSPDDIDVKQNEAGASPLPDGTIPPTDSPISSEPVTPAEPQDLNADVSADRTSAAPRKKPLAEDKEKQDEGISPSSSKKSTIPDPKFAVIEDEGIPAGVDVNVFQSARVAKSLGSHAHSRPGEHQSTAHSDSFTALKKNEKDVADVHRLAADLAKDVDVSQNASQAPNDVPRVPQSEPYRMRESRVPSSRIGRIWEYAGLGTSMAFGAVGETLRRVTGSGSGGSLMLSAGNMDRLVAKLSHMRGAALKLGQMMSFQDSKMLPEPIAEVLQRVQDNADYMPPTQRNKVLSSNLGSEWRDIFSSFDEVPLAAASIGQVHRAVLQSNNQPVAVKIQYPGVATSISSDLSNLSILLTASRLLPKGLFLDKTIANARTELAWECDYEREADCQSRFRELLHDETATFVVPQIFKEASGPQVLTAEMMGGIAVTKPTLHLSQEQRDWIGTHILRLSIRELTEFKFMQTDPNWTNFLFNESTNKIELLDFGAARDFPDKFVDLYVRLLIAAAEGDRETVHEKSLELGYLTGHEGKTMIDAHIGSVMTLAEPFSASRADDAVYDFHEQSVTDRVRSFIPVMLRERLSPPPEETYSLHRKLSGAFLLLARLGSRVKTRDMFKHYTEAWVRRRGGLDNVS